LGGKKGKGLAVQRDETRRRKQTRAPTSRNYGGEKTAGIENQQKPHQKKKKKKKRTNTKKEKNHPQGGTKKNKNPSFPRKIRNSNLEDGHSRLSEAEEIQNEKTFRPGYPLQHDSES